MGHLRWVCYSLVMFFLTSKLCSGSDDVEVPELSPVGEESLTRERRNPTVPPISALRISKITSNGFRASWDVPPPESHITSIRLRLEMVNGDFTHEETLRRKLRYYKFKGLNPATRYVLSLQSEKKGTLSTAVLSEVTTATDPLDHVSTTSEVEANVRRIIGEDQSIRFVDVCQKTKQTDLVILIDGSWSVGQTNFKKMQVFLASLANAFVIGPNRVLVGVAQYSDDPRTEFALGEHTTKEAVTNAINRVRYKGGNTATGRALTYLREVMFAPGQGTRSNSEVRKTAVVITDGESLIDDVTEPAQQLRDIGVEVFSIGIDNALQSELEDIASDPDVDHVFSVKNFDRIDEIKDKLLADVCKSVPICPPPDPIDNGEVSCNHVDQHMPGTTCKFTCNGPIYKLHNHREASAGIAVRNCRKDGTWDKPQPSCDLSVCPDLNNPSNGRYNCTNGFKIGSDCTLKCSLGYRLSQTISPKCRKNARWSSPGPTCIQIVCPHINAIPHGSVECDNENFYQSFCRFKCDEGYRINGVPVTECRERGTWTRPSPTCTIITCSPLSSLANGNTDCNDAANYASQCVFTCNDGYELKGSSQAVCDSQGWWGFNDGSKMPRCERIMCDPLPVNEHMSKDCSQGNNYDSVCTFTCDAGYNMVGGNVAKCTGKASPGNWTNESPSCQIATCPVLQAQPHSQIQCSDNQNYRSVCSITCNKGYELASPSRAVCEATGLWSGGLSSCERISCDEAEPIQHGSVSCTDSNYYNSKCEYECDTGYEITEGDQTRVCGLNKLYSGVAPTCSLITCSALSQPSNGVASCSGNTYGSRCKFSCNTGFEISGSLKRTCQEDGTWSGEEASCTLLKCDPLTAPENGDMSCTAMDDFDENAAIDTTTGYGTKCDFKCHDGYFIMGSKTRVCGKDQEWSGEEPHCVRIRCPPLPEPLHASMACSETNEFGSECVVQCDIGYYMSRGTSNRVCKTNGKWSGKDAVCNIKTCDNLVAKPHTTLSCTNGQRYGSICTIKPELGYKLRGPSVVECTEEGALDTSLADLVVCPPLGPPRNGNVRCTNNYDFASVCSYTCKGGYDLAGSASQTCMADGDWSDDKATCEIATCPRLTAPENGGISCTDTNVYQSSCSYSCNEGYELSDDRPRKCQANHAWTGNEVVCKRITCDELDPPKHGDVSCSRENDYHSDCTFHCDEGYEMKGSRVRTCGVNHTWSGDATSCSGITCLELKTPRNGKKKCTDANHFASECSFVCEVGYMFSGSKERVCRADHTWSGQEVACAMVKCGELEASQNGSKRCEDEDNYDSTCRFSCDLGYDLLGSSRRTCEADGRWSGKTTSCSIVRCGSAKAPKYGFVNCNMEDKYESVCKYKCRVGFDIAGSSMRVCQSDHHWSGTKPSCQLVRCRPLKAPQNGAVSCTDGDQYGSLCDYSCNEGYRFTGPEPSGRLCTADHVWSGTQAYCEEITCDELETPDNAFIECSRGFSYGSECTLVAKPGYSYDGLSEISCGELGAWSAVLGIGNLRTLVCQDLEAPAHGTMECTTRFEFQSTCSFTCELGYELQGSSSRTCQETQEWTGDDTRCELIECPAIPTPRNGVMNCSKEFQFQSVCKFECEEGYEVLGSEATTCQLSRSWTNERPLCALINCGPISTPQNGRVDCTAGDVYNSVCSVTCNVGFELSGSESRTCLDSKEWSGDEPTCNIVRCGVRNPPLQGTISCSALDAYSSTCSYNCNVGYKLIGDEVTTCGKDGMWLGAIPSCELIRCEQLSSPANGHIKCTSGNEYNSLCRTICMTGYELVGSSSRICQGDGTFSGTPSKCKLITCNAADELEHGQVSCSDFSNYDSECRFTCDRGYRLIGSTSRRCLSSGYWSDTVPHCENIRCRRLREPPHSNMTCSNENMASSICSIECKTCYNLLGSSKRTCREDGSWSGEEPACAVISCPPLRTPINGVKECHANEQECGNTCQFSCNPGYQLIGSEVRNCQESRLWTGETSECIRNECPTLISLDEEVVIGCTNGSHIGSNCSFSCSGSDSSLVGSPYRVCLKGGIWSNTDPVCRACKTAISDIIFVVDGSWSVGDQNFKKVKDFLKALVLPFHVGWDNTRFGVVQYSDDPRTEFLLSDYLTLNEVMSAIDAIPYKGGNTNTGRAVTFSLYNALSLSSGARPFVRKTALILTDGRSQDDVGNPAREMRNAGIRVVTVGVGDADVEELKLMASPPHDTSVYHVKDYDSIKQIQSLLAAKLCEDDHPRPSGMCNCPPGPPGPPGIPGTSGESPVPGETLKGAKGDPFTVIHVNYADQVIEARNSDGSVTSLNLPDSLQPIKSTDGDKVFFPIKGEPGSPGLTGVKGEAGRAGLDGTPGRPGDPGPQGPPGLRGPEGPVGPRGSPGQKGSTGEADQPASIDEDGIIARARREAVAIVQDKISQVLSKLDRDKRLAVRPVPVAGPPGPPGPPGKQGYEGPSGPRGHPGITGLRGIKGSKGDTGDPGARGVPGRGSPGPQGPPGPRGKPGKSIRGKTGPRGPPGKSKKSKTTSPKLHINRF